MRFYSLIALASAVTIENAPNFSELVEKATELPRPDLSIVDKEERFSQRELDRQVKHYIEAYSG